MKPPLKKIILIVVVMLASYFTLLTIINHSKKLAETDSEATQKFK